MTKKEFLKAHELHQEWLEDNTKGKRFEFHLSFSFKLDIKINLHSANLRYANLRYADLSYANLSYADLSYADLSYANIRCADLSYADLSYADLSYADLSSADLRYADLDYSAWPLWCGSTSVIIDKKLQAQLLYHSFINSEMKPTEEQLNFIKENWIRYRELKCLEVGKQ